MKDETDDFISVRNRNMALAQCYRLFHFFEAPQSDLTTINHLELFADDAAIVSDKEVLKGKKAIADSLRLSRTGKHAHHLQQVAVRKLDEDMLQVTASVLYQNEPFEKQISSEIFNYTVLLSIHRNDLPLITAIHKQSKGLIENPVFKATYIENRAMSFMHYWLYLMATTDRNAQKFKEVLSANFSIQLFNREKMVTMAVFENWIESIHRNTREIRQVPINLNVSESADNTIQVSLLFYWAGISAKENRMVAAEILHEWTLENIKDERFATMKMMKARTIENIEL